MPQQVRDEFSDHEQVTAKYIRFVYWVASRSKRPPQGNEYTEFPLTR